MEPSIDRKEFERLLRDRRAELAEAGRDTEGDRRPVPLDQTSVGRLSRMSALQDQAMAQAAQRRRLGEIARIDAALRRIEDGEFGYCVECGEEIDRKRLALDPAVPTCLRCAAARSR